MSETANSEGASESEKPVQSDGVQFPPFPDPKDEDFDDDISEEERSYYKTIFKDINQIKGMRLHCTACDRHLGCSARNEVRMRAHPMLRTLVCHNCHVFYNSGEFEKGDDGSELYCRWCGQGGQVYCCSDCPHVFCAKCIKRNLGAPKIKEIENADDWKCFKCNSKCLWDLRALCWAVLRFCDLKNKLVHQTQDPQLKEAYKKDCSIDYSECCKSRTLKRVHKLESAKKKEIKKEVEVKSPDNIISKIPSTIQVKKFASVNMEECKTEKKTQKRSISPKHKPASVKNPINVAPSTRLLNPISVPPLAKKIRLPNSPMLTPPVRVTDRKNMSTYTRIRPKPSQPIAIANCSFNGFGANVFNTDNINLSLESLTQGLDMSAVAAISQNSQDDDVVCTPDFPLEPLCEVTEDNDDDVQCITPGPVVPPKFVNPPPLVPRTLNNLSTELTSDNIIQMTENDVTVNASTGGLKFRVDPQTLSSNKMYRLPDGRIFAINANPAMPGGYSATIVAFPEPAGKPVPKGATYAAKLSAITTSTPTPTPKTTRNIPRILKRSTPKTVSITKSSESSSRECDLNVPVEWYRYNLIDAVDALEYALSRLHKLKKEATTVYLRTRTVHEMRNLHRTLERLLSTSSSRFGEIRENLNKGLKQYVLRKSGDNANNSEDDDDVEILPDLDNDDPIFIDENSVESTMNGSENQEVDLTGAGSSEYNDSGENTKGNNLSNTVVESSENDKARGHRDVLAVISHKSSFVDASVNEITSQDCDNKKESNSENVKDSEMESVKECISECKLNENKESAVNNKESHVSENESESNEQESKLDNNIITGPNKVTNNESNNEVEGNKNIGMDIGTENMIKESIIDNNGMNSNVTPKCNDAVNEDDGEVNGNTEAVLNQDKLCQSEEIENSMNHKVLNEKADSQDIMIKSEILK